MAHNTFDTLKQVRMDMQGIDRDLRHAFKSQESRLLYQLGSLLVAGFSFIASLQVLLH